MCAILCHYASSIMIPHAVILNAIRCHSEYTLCHSERSEESPQSRPATTRVDSVWPARRLPRLVPSLAMTMYGINLAMTVDSV